VAVKTWDEPSGRVTAAGESVSRVNIFGAVKLHDPSAAAIRNNPICLRRVVASVWPDNHVDVGGTIAKDIESFRYVLCQVDCVIAANVEPSRGSFGFICEDKRR